MFLKIGRPSVGRELLNVPMGEMIRQMAFAIADAQVALDASSVETAQMMGGLTPIYRQENGETIIDFEDSRVFFGTDEEGNPERISMLELGFSPTFYQFVDTIIEVKIDVTLTESNESNRESQDNDYDSSYSSRGGGIIGFFGGPTDRETSISTSQVNATHSQKYNHSVEGSSLLRTKLVPIPPPAILEERIRRIMDKKFKEEE